jgi:hypothetical protein
MSNSEEKIIHEVIAELREDRARQEDACLEAIKFVHATQQSPSWFNEQTFIAPVGQITKGPGAFAKSSVHVEFIGWYRDGQTTGLPSQRMPLEKEIDDQYEAYYAMLRSSVPPEALAAQLDRRSGKSRVENGLQPLIRSRYNVTLGSSIPKHHRVKFIAKEIGYSVE